MVSSNTFRSVRSKVFAILILSGLSVVGNYLSLPLFFGVDLIFGSIAVMLAILTLGTAPACLIAFLGSTYTFVLWGHPYAIIIFSLEALVVSLLYQRGFKLVIADLLYWLVLGIPLIFVFYALVMEMNDTSTLLIAFKQSLNGILNALVIGTLVLCVPWLFSRFRRQELNPPRMENVLFHALVAMTFMASFIPIVFESYSYKKIHQLFVQETLERDISLVESFIDNGYHWQPSHELDELLSVLRADEASIHVSSRAGETLFFSGDMPLNLEEGNVRLLTETLAIWLPKVTGSTMTRWKHGSFFIERSMDHPQVSKIRLMTHAKHIVTKLEERTITLFSLLSLLVLISLGLSVYISRFISQPLARLNETAKHIPEDILSGTHPQLPALNLQEYLGLKETLEVMSETLRVNFEQLQRSEAGLEDQVKKSTKALDDQLNHTQAILNNILDGIITINARGIIQSCNPAGFKLFGYQEAQMIGQNVKILMPNPFREAHDGYLKNYHDTRDAKIIGIGREVVGLRSDGSTFPMELAVSEIRLKDEIFYVGMVRDISERKLMEKMKAEFISTVSHELRTPLTAISGSLSLALGGAIGTMPEEMKSMLQVAYQNSQRLNLLINDLLDMEKLLAGKMDFQFKTCSLLSLLQEAVASNQSYADQYRVHIELVACPEEVLVSVDEIRFAQIMSNLLSNAVKYSPESASVLVSALEEDDRVRVSVSDSGAGIPTEFHGRMFQKFSQADSSDTRQKGGTGLGLAITRELVERMQGNIDFNTSNKGTEFFVYLPMIHLNSEGRSSE